MQTKLLSLQKYRVKNDLMTVIPKRFCFWFKAVHCTCAPGLCQGAAVSSLAGSSSPFPRAPVSRKASQGSPPAADRPDQVWTLRPLRVWTELRAPRRRPQVYEAFAPDCCAVAGAGLRGPSNRHPGWLPSLVEKTAFSPQLPLRQVPSGQGSVWFLSQAASLWESWGLTKTRYRVFPGDSVVKK